MNKALFVMLWLCKNLWYHPSNLGKLVNLGCAKLTEAHTVYVRQHTEVRMSKNL